MIKAEVIAASRCIETDAKICTMKVVMPRFILAEFNTHRMFSRNSASSRAIPFSKMARTVQENPFIPLAWQEDHKGMQGTEYLDEQHSSFAKSEWKHRGLGYALDVATSLNNNGVTKQLCNRLLEPFMYHTVLVTATEWDNFFNLRCPQYYVPSTKGEPFFDTTFKSRRELIKTLSETTTGNFEGTIETALSMTDLDWLSFNKGTAEIHMMALAEAMYDAYHEARCEDVLPGDYHIPFGDNISDTLLDNLIRKENLDNPMIQYLPKDVAFNHQTRLYYKIAISIARCARLSYQTLGDNPVTDYEKDLELYHTLVNNGHSSPSEHVAKAMSKIEFRKWGKTILENNAPKQVFGYCNNFCGFIQQRAIINDRYYDED